MIGDGHKRADTDTHVQNDSLIYIFLFNNVLLTTSFWNVCIYLKFKNGLD